MDLPPERTITRAAAAKGSDFARYPCTVISCPTFNVSLRQILNDEEQTRYYLDPNNGALVQRADTTGRWRRWLFSGLHRLDFTPFMRSRPFWDIMMWLTMLGGLAVSLTGVYLAVRRVHSDVTVLFRRRTSSTRASESQVTP